MTKMTKIKVAYQSTVRRFPISDTITWLELESKLRELFSLPPTFKFSLSYIDEEKDAITLSTDLELQEYLSQPFQSTFTITPEQQQPFVVETFSSDTSENGFVSIEKDEKERFIPDNVSEKTDKHDIIMDAVDEPSFKPTIPSTSKGKQKEEPQEQDETQEQPSPNNNEQKAPFIELAEQFQGLLDQFKDVLLEHPQLIEQANDIMDHILLNLPVDIDECAEWLKAFRPEGDTSSTNAQEGESNNSRDQQQRDRFRRFPFLPPPWVRQMFQDNCPGVLGNLRSGLNGDRPYQQQEELSQETLKKNVNILHSMGIEIMTDDPQTQRIAEELSQEALKEKINLLHSMGFWDDVKNEELLKKYNVEWVVELLIRQQTERNNNNSNETHSSMEGVVDDQ